MKDKGKKEPSEVKENLRRQTIIIEDVTAELKAFVCVAVFSGLAAYKYRCRSREIILNGLAEVDDETMRKDATEALILYSVKQFGRMRANLLSVPGFTFDKMHAVQDIYNAESVADKDNAYMRLQRLEPSFRGQAQMFSAGSGSSRNIGMPLRIYMRDYMRLVDDTCRMLKDSSAKDFDGLPLRMKSELYMRHEWQSANLEKIYASGKKLVWISSHVNCSERCQPHQGKLYSTDGTSGVTSDGYEYKPLSVATDIYYTTKKGKVYKNGCLTGFGCRHYTFDYEQNGVVPDIYDGSEIEKAQKIETTQRKLEREIFHAREGYYVYRGQDKVKARFFYTLAREKKAEYVKFCTDNKVAWYPDRIKVKP